MSTRVQNDFVMQVRDSFLNIFVFDMSKNVCFIRISENKGVGERGRGGGGGVCGRNGNCHRNNELC